MSEKRRNLAILGIVLVVLLGSVAVIATKSFKLGLDLKGGVEVVLAARPQPGEQVTSQDMSLATEILRKRIDPQGVLSPDVRSSTNPNQITVDVPGLTDPLAAEKLLVSSGQLQNFNLFGFLSPVSTQSQYVAKPYASLFDLLTAAKPTIKKGASGKPDVSGWALFDKTTKKQYGAVEPTQHQVLQDVIGKKLPATADRVWLGVPANNETVYCHSVNGCPSAQASGTWWYLFKLNVDERGNPYVVTGDQVTAVSTTDPQSGAPIVQLNYKNGGGAEFTNITRRIVVQNGTPAAQQAWPSGLPTAIVVDGQLVAFPTVNQVIDTSINDSSIITNLSKAEADRIALEVQSGSLPVKFTAISFTTVSATLGSDALRNAIIAGGAGLLFVMIFLIAFYGFLGVIADIALIIYGIILAAIVLLIPVTMTLPGIAGTILTIGVAADANIVIFERIKEEVRAGKTIRTAIGTGYRRGFHTIIDANVVTLITAVVLYLSTTSSVKGFALMLLIGVVTSIFTAVVATRAMLGTLAGFSFMSGTRVLGSLGTGNRWRRIDFIGKKRIWFALSGIVIVISVFSLATSGLKQGIDFTGGSEFQFKTPQAQTVGDVTSVFARAGVPNPDVRGLGKSEPGGFTQFQIFSHTLKPSVQDQIINSAAQRYKINPNEISVRNVSSSFGNTVLDQAYLAIVFSLLIIFAYVTFRFEWRFAVPVMIALAHDIIITLGVYSADPA